MIEAHWGVIAKGNLEGSAYLSPLPHKGEPELLLQGQGKSPREGIAFCPDWPAT